MLILPALQILLIFDIGLGFLHCLYSGVVPRIICGSKWRAGRQLRAGDILTRPSFSNTLLCPDTLGTSIFNTLLWPRDTLGTSISNTLLWPRDTLGTSISNTLLWPRDTLGTPSLQADTFGTSNSNTSII